MVTREWHAGFRVIVYISATPIAADPGVGACPVPPVGVAPLHALCKKQFSNFPFAGLNARALEPLWNLKPNGISQQNVRSKKIGINFSDLDGGRTRTRTLDPLIFSKRPVWRRAYRQSVQARLSPASAATARHDEAHPRASWGHGSRPGTWTLLGHDVRLIY